MWRYLDNDRNYRGWHLNADKTGCQSLIELIDALARDGGGMRHVPLVTPTAAQLGVPNKRDSPWVSSDKWRVTYAGAGADWIFGEGNTPASLTFGESWLQPLREGISGIARGRGDYTIGDSKQGERLWFWW